MTKNDLAAQVAIEFVKEQLSSEKGGSLRFCMVGLEKDLVVGIAKVALRDARICRELHIRIPQSFDPDASLSRDVISDESITHWRHCKLEDGVRGVLFAATHDELQRNDKSLEKVTRIETDGLRELHSLWIELAGLTAQYVDEAKRRHIEAALAAANESHVVRTIEAYAGFVMEISNAVIHQGLPVQRAIDSALPALMLPRNAGYFDRLPDRKRTSVSEWTKLFRRLHKRIRPYLFRENYRGDPITEKLVENLEEIRDRLSKDEIGAIEAFLKADLSSEDRWTQAQGDLAALDWRSVSELFDGVQGLKPEPLGERTIKFFQEEFDDQLDEEDRDLLSGSLPKEPTDRLEEFFELRRELLARNKKLYGQWERYIYRNPQRFDDFLVGLIATLNRLRDRVDDADCSSRRLVVRIPRAREKSFWRRKNNNVVRYFAFRYRGLGNLLGQAIELDFGRLFEFYFPKPDVDLQKATSSARDARQLKFEVSLDPSGVDAKLLFIWEMPSEALATAMADDVLRIANIAADRALLPTAEITRLSVSAKGQIQRIALNDVNTIGDVENGNEGRLVAPNQEIGDRGEPFLRQLDGLRSAFLAAGPYRKIKTAFDEFACKYTQAIREWVGDQDIGVSSSAMVTQANAFGRLLTALLKHANNDLARSECWHEILRIGIANVGGSTPAAVITPWHPLRLAEIHIKTRQAADLIVKVLNASEDEIFRADILLREETRELKSIYYPEVCLGFEDDQPIMLSATETLFDYTLAEPPRRQQMHNGEDALDIDPGIAAKAFSAVAEQYLNLLPHERSNFSVVLYNAESKALPGAIAAELSSKVEQQSELQCDLLLTHADPAQMRRIYEQQNVAVSSDAGSVMASEAAKNFLSRLRVGFLDASTIPEDEKARTSDLVFLQDVIARNAEVRWKTTPVGRQPELLHHVPARWSRRRPVGPNDHASAVYLVSPVQPMAGQSYLNAVHTFLDGDNARAGDVVPAREISFKDAEVADVFYQTHRIGEWVVNFDELVDRRLLSNNDVHVIRHIHDRSVDRNIVVSTTSKPRLLRALLRERLDRIDPSIVATHEDKVIDELIERANTLSGQIVMRAARYGHFANELLGVVLSMRQLETGLGEYALPMGWFFLDDFASWFGQREEQIADIMVIAPRVVSGKPVLKIAISEAKFVGSASYREYAKKSARQLGDTVARLSRALEPNRDRIDRKTWLHRLGDFMLEGMKPYSDLPTKGWDLHRWSDEVRQDNIPIVVAGFSHVFVHDDENYVDSGGLIPLKGMEHCAQEIFDRSGVAAELRMFAAHIAEAESPAGPAETWKDSLVSRSIEEKADTPQGDTTEVEATTEQLGVATLRARQAIEQSEAGGDGQQPTVAPFGAKTAEARDEPSVNPLSRVSSSSQHKWRSSELRAWISGGRASGEEDKVALAWRDTTVKNLQRALRGYDMTAELIGSRLTPNAALVRLRGSDDLTIPKVERRRQELLTSHGIDVINVLAAPLEIVVMIRRPQRVLLHLRDMWRLRELPDSAPESNTSLLLGAREDNGEHLYLNVGERFLGYEAHGPHTLIAGETGSGKGVLVQNLLLDLCATNAPESASIRMIDPKAGIDYPWLRRMPHLRNDLVTTQPEAIQVFEELVDEMERRNRILAEAGVTKLAQFNRRVTSEDPLPRIWLFHDELADWMLMGEYRDAVATNVTRLGVKARAAGIHLVLVTQRPDKDALPMQLRANLSNRLVLKVADKRNSELVLDEAGAERLLGRGHLAARLSGEGAVILAQVPFADETEIEELARAVVATWTVDTKRR